MNKKILSAIAIAIAMCTIVTSSMSISAATGYRTVTNSRTQKSIVGIPVYKIGVSGQVYSNGKKLSKWSDAKCLNATYYPGWSVQSQKASWTIKDKDYSKVTNTSTFFYGLDTQWVKIGIQSNTDTISKTVTP
ncbi:MAG: hypothetical protein HFJ09_15375 [Lachnospiraceae bacterium]|nr:hypothetical protein [Lachnospiraceae bacterium]